MSDRIRTVIKTEFRAGHINGKGKIRNVGEGGLFVGTSTIPEEGEPVRLRFRTPYGMPIEVSGLVWWTRRDPLGLSGTEGFGLRFLDDEADDVQQLLSSL